MKKHTLVQYITVIIIFIVVIVFVCDHIALTTKAYYAEQSSVDLLRVTLQSHGSYFYNAKYIVITEKAERYYLNYGNTGNYDRYYINLLKFRNENDHSVYYNPRKNMAKYLILTGRFSNTKYDSNAPYGRIKEQCLRLDQLFALSPAMLQACLRKRNYAIGMPDSCRT